MHLYLKCVSYRQYIFWSFYFIQCENLCLLFGVFGSTGFNAVTINSTLLASFFFILLVIFYLFHSSFLLFLSLIFGLLLDEFRIYYDSILCIIGVCVWLLSCVQLFVTTWAVVSQAPLSMEFSRWEYWSGLLFPSPGDVPNPENEPESPALQADSLPSEPPGKPFCIIISLLFVPL